jgi:hypothetical protein
MPRSPVEPPPVADEERTFHRRRDLDRLQLRRRRAVLNTILRVHHAQESSGPEQVDQLRDGRVEPLEWIDAGEVAHVGLFGLEWLTLKDGEGEHHLNAPVSSRGWRTVTKVSPAKRRAAIRRDLGLISAPTIAAPGKRRRSAASSAPGEQPKDRMRLAPGSSFAARSNSSG